MSTDASTVPETNNSAVFSKLLQDNSQYVPVVIGAAIGIGISMLSPFITTIVMGLTGAHLGKQVGKKGLKTVIDSLIENY